MEAVRLLSALRGRNAERSKPTNLTVAIYWFADVLTVCIGAILPGDEERKAVVDIFALDGDDRKLPISRA